MMHKILFFFLCVSCAKQYDLFNVKSSYRNDFIVSSDTQVETLGTVYMREKKEDIWGDWVIKDSKLIVSLSDCPTALSANTNLQDVGTTLNSILNVLSDTTFYKLLQKAFIISTVVDASKLKEIIVSESNEYQSIINNLNVDKFNNSSLLFSKYVKQDANSSVSFYFNEIESSMQGGELLSGEVKISKLEFQIYVSVAKVHLPDDIGQCYKSAALNKYKDLISENTQISVLLSTDVGFLYKNSIKSNKENINISQDSNKYSVGFKLNKGTIFGEALMKGVLKTPEKSKMLSNENILDTLKNPSNILSIIYDDIEVAVPIGGRLEILNNKQ